MSRNKVLLRKSSLGALATVILAFLLAEPLPGAFAAAALLAIGATGYGLSLRLYLLAQRAFGAGRTGSVFAFAPFIGALGEAHGHKHSHDVLEHEHAHTHADGHHLHAHSVVPNGQHSHWHSHEPVQHEHVHVPDAHHLHLH